MSIKILQLSALKSKGLGELDKILNELRPAANPPTALLWRKILQQKNLRIFGAEKNGVLIGMAILRWHDLPVGRVGTLEDVVVDASRRGEGIGTQLMKAVILFAKKQKMTYIDLTSRPERIAANRLYQKIGWKKRETNVYRLTL